MIVTVIATGFEEEKPALHSYQTTTYNNNDDDDSDDADVPSFLRNRGF